MRKPDYRQLMKVLDKQKPDRPTLFEFFLNGSLYELLTKGEAVVKNDGLDYDRLIICAFEKAGYDYVTISASDFCFPSGDKEGQNTYSLNKGAVITDRASYERYTWQDPCAFDYSRLDTCAADLPEGMKFIVYGPGGVLENVISLVGYDNLCFMLYEDPGLAGEIFDRVGDGLVHYYEQAVGYDSVCALISNDDWGFKTQTMISPDDMRKYVFPWHKKIVNVGHTHNKPVILHSCGMLEDVMEDIITDMAYDAKHSFEDAIMPIEDAYEKYKGRIALLGGIDMHFICTAEPAAIAARSRDMLARVSETGGYALGTGNSVPEYVPNAHYFAMIDVAR